VKAQSLPSKTAAGWGPGAEQLAEQDDAAQVVGVVGGEADELLLHCHGAGGFAGAARALYVLLHAGLGMGDDGGLADELEKAVAEVSPGFGGGLVFVGEADVWVRGVGGGHGVAPIERDAKPEGDVPELLIDGVGSAGDEAVSECFRQGFKDVRRRRVGAAARESFLKFIHAHKSKSTRADCQ
jgi:hypothetical protein